MRYDHYLQFGLKVFEVIMMTAGKICEHGKDLWVSNDEDMLENTKPNLISFSLSTSSSSHTNVSAESNSDRMKTEYTDSRNADIKKEADKIGNAEGEPSNNIINVPSYSSNSTVYTDSVEFTDKGTVNTKLWEDALQNTCPKLCENAVEQDITELSLDFEKNILSRHHSVSMHNLYEVLDSPKNNLVRVASQPQLNKHFPKNDSLFTRSKSSIPVISTNRSYTRVQSKVKNYIQQLKRERVADESMHPINEVKENNNVSQSEQESIIELQKEIERLQTCVEERDTLLQEVQANHHSLLLQYGEAKNRLDQMRLVSIKPQQSLKSVQTEYYPKVDKKVSVCFPITDPCPGSSNQRNEVSDVKEHEKWIYENTDALSWSTNFSEMENLKVSMGSKHVELEPEENRIHPPNTTMLKVSTWFTSLPQQPLPVPSCYGSLASSGNACSSQEDNEIDLEKKSLPFPKINQETISNYLKNENRIPVSVSQTNHWNEKHNLQEEDEKLHDANGRNFLSIEKCDCWNSCDLPDCDVVHDVEISSMNSVCSDARDCVLNTVCVPPLDLAHSKDSTSIEQAVPFQDCGISSNSVFCKIPFSNTSHSVNTCNSRLLKCQECSRKKTESFHDESKYSLDTPTSYRSILINYQRNTKTNSNIQNGNTSGCASCNASSCQKHEFHCTAPESNIPKVMKAASNWEKKHQHLCCQRKRVTSEEDSIGRSIGCCTCVWTLDEMSRVEDGTSNDISKQMHSKIPPDVMKCLNSVAACAEDLRRRSEAIQIFLTKLVQTASESNYYKY